MDGIRIFFFDTSKFLDVIDKQSYQCFLDGNLFKSQKRIEQYCLGRFLIKYVLKKYYSIENPTIVLKNKKPCLQLNNENDLQISFSLSHSRNMIMAAFYASNEKDVELGLDIEYMKPRDFEKLLKYYQVETDVYDAKTFYSFWTQYEANIKLQSVQKTMFTCGFLNEFILSLVTNIDILDIEKNVEFCEFIIDENVLNNGVLDLKYLFDNSNTKTFSTKIFKNRGLNECV